MKRSNRATIASETVAICEAGYYVAPGGKRVPIVDDLRRAKEGTVLYSAETVPPGLGMPKPDSTTFEVRNETSFQAIQRLAGSQTRHIACLNFASAKNPGGGFLKGSLAQEEALACASGLYPCLMAAPDYYEKNRSNRSTLYLDLAIFSPLVPFFRDDAGILLDGPILCSVITAPAPNAGAISQNEPENSRLVEPTMLRRAELILNIAAAHTVNVLILGAWGCGVFRNDPTMVAEIFAQLLKPPGKFSHSFQHVAFAVLDRSQNLENFKPFANLLEGGAQ